MDQHPSARYDWLGLNAAASYLGVSDRQLRRWVQQQRIGYARLGLHLRFTTEELDAFVVRSTVPARTTR